MKPCLWFAALLAQAAAAATVIPLFVLLAERVDRRTAWFAAALWPLVPGIAVFLPKSDAVFPLFSILGPCLWLVGWRRRSLICCALAGLTLLFRHAAQPGDRADRRADGAGDGHRRMVVAPP